MPLLMFSGLVENRTMDHITALPATPVLEFARITVINSHFTKIVLTNHGAEKTSTWQRSYKCISNEWSEHAVDMIVSPPIMTQNSPVDFCIECASIAESINSAWHPSTDRWKITPSCKTQSWNIICKCFATMGRITGVNCSQWQNMHTIAMFTSPCYSCHSGWSTTTILQCNSSCPRFLVSDYRSS